MFFDNLSDISKITMQHDCTIFVLPKDTGVNINGALVLEPTDRATISVEKAREIMSKLTTKQLETQFILIRPAESLSLEAENAILKNLEEPKDNVHFVLVTQELTRLLPTILSRAAVYFWRGGMSSITEISADTKLKEKAKKLLAAGPQDLLELAEELTRKKDEVRKYVLDVLSVAIEMAYKTFLLTGKNVYLLKVPKLLAAYDNISSNGHIKLHLVADLV